jgi:hypothetical protein
VSGNHLHVKGRPPAFAVVFMPIGEVDRQGHFGHDRGKTLLGFCLIFFIDFFVFFNSSTNFVKIEILLI